MKIAIITGASSGLGEKLLYETEKRFSLDEIWIIARRKERLEALAAKCTGAASAGRNVYTPRAFFKFYRFLAKILPHSLVMRMSKT